MKKVILILLCLICFGCVNKEEKENTMLSFVETSSYSSIVNKMDQLIQDISMFPDKEKENDFIHLVQAVVQKANKFSSEELENIYQKLQMNYQFSFNSLKYTITDYLKDLTTIKEKIERN